MTAKSKKLFLALILVIGLLAVPTVSGQSSCTEQKFWYPFNGSATDYSGCGNDGIIENGASISNGVAVFEGSEGYINTTVDDSNLDTGNLSIHVNVSVSNSDTKGVFVEERDDGNTYKGWTFQHIADNDLSFVAYDGSNVKEVQWPYPDLTNGSYHAFSVVYNDNQGEISLYESGSLVSTKSLSYSNIQTDREVIVGNRYAYGGSSEVSGDNELAGNISEISVYSNVSTGFFKEESGDNGISGSIQFEEFGETGETINFTENISDSDGSIQSYEWSFGDGGSSTNGNTTYSYSNEGRYQVKLTVTDDDSNQETFTGYIRIDEDFVLEKNPDFQNGYSSNSFNIGSDSIFSPVKSSFTSVNRSESGSIDLNSAVFQGLFKGWNNKTYDILPGETSQPIVFDETNTTGYYYLVVTDADSSTTHTDVYRSADMDSGSWSLVSDNVYESTLNAGIDVNGTYYFGTQGNPQTNNIQIVTASNLTDGSTYSQANALNSSFDSDPELKYNRSSDVCHMYFEDGHHASDVAHATSSDCVNWDLDPNNPVFTFENNTGDFGVTEFNDDRLVVFMDNTVNHPEYNVTIGTATDYDMSDLQTHGLAINTTFSSDVRGVQDANLRYDGVEGEFHLYYEATASNSYEMDTGKKWLIGAASLPADLDSDFDFVFESDTSGDGVFDTVQSFNGLDENYRAVSEKDLSGYSFLDLESFSPSYKYRFNYSSSLPLDNVFIDEETETYGIQSEDTTAPSLSIDSPLNQTYSNSSVDLNVTSDEAVSTWEYSLDGAANQAFTPNTTLTGLSDGSHTVDVYATDSSGNTGSESVSFTVDATDTTPPTSSDNWTASGFVDKTEVDVNLTATDDDSGVANISYQVNGGGYTTVTGSSTTVTINTQGNNTLDYYATDNAGNVEAVNTEYVALDANAAPSASFSFSPSMPVVGENVNFDASGSSDSDGSIVSYEWDWTNDGTFEASGVTASHSYSSSSNFNAVLKVTDDDGSTDTVSKVVEVQSGSVDNPAPEVNLSLNATNIVVGDSVFANVSASDDGNISMLELDWEGDGIYDESGFVNEFNATNTFNESGIYSVTARAEDDEGKETLESVTVNVDNVRTSTNKSIISSCENSTSSDGFCLENRSDETSIQGFTNDDSYTFEASVDVINSIVGEFTLFGFVNTTSGRNDGVESGKVNVSVSDESSVVNDPPTAEYSISPTDPTPGETISFDGSLSSDPDGSIVSYEWDWTNDGAIDDTGVNPSHSYGSEGDYTARLVVTDDEGATSTYTNTVPVQSESSDGAGGGGDDGSDDGGGSIGDPGDGDSTNEASADGSSVNLISPKSQTKFVGDSLALDESASDDTTVTIGGSDNTFKLVEIIDGNTAKIEVNSLQNYTLDIGEDLPLNFGVNDASRVYLSSVTDTEDVGEVSLNIYGTGYFADDTASPYYSYNYSLDGAADVSLLIKNTEDSSFTEVDSFSSNSAVNGTQTFVGNESSGIYEAKLELNTENSTVETDKVGFYLGKVPVIDILRPSNGVTIERPAAQSNVSAPLDFEFRLANNVSSNISTYYEGVGTGKRFDGNIESVDVRNREDGILETFVRKGLNLAFSWTDKIQFEPDVDVQGNSSVYISEKGGFDGFVNVSVFGEDNSVSARSVPISIDVVGLNYRNESERRDYFDSRDGDSEQSFVLSPSVNESVGNNSSVRYFDSRFAVFEPNPDKRFEVRDLGNFDVGIDFDFVVNASDSSQVNRSLFVESVNGSKVVERELNPLQAQHFETLDESDFNGSWSEGKYRVYGKTFYENGSVLQTVDPDHSFYVQDATPGLIEYTFGSIVEALTTVYDFTTDRAGLLIALFGVGGWYAGFKSRNYDFLARWGALGLFAFFSGWIPGGPVYIPGSIQAVVLTVAAATLTLKFLRGDITL